MAELLVRIKNKVPDNDPRAHLFLREGEVVAVCPDEHEWGSNEKNNPDWIILKLPNITEQEASVMLGRHVGDMPNGELPQRREFRIDLEKLKNYKHEELKYEDLEELKIRRKPKTDPRFFGSNRRSIG